MSEQTSRATNSKVSAVIPCYNGERFLGPAIEALLNQTRPADEVIVVDDGSTDGSAGVAQRYPQVRLIQHKGNKGLSQARNTALETAAGDTIVYTDVDAYADSGLIQAMVAEYTSDDIGGVGGQGIESNIRNIYDLWRKSHASQTSGDHPNRNAGFLWGLCSSFRKQALEKVGGFDTFYRTNAEDVDITLRLRKAGYRLVYTPDARVYHQRSDSYKSLMAMVYRWNYWGHVAHLKNSRQMSRLCYWNVLRTFLFRGTISDVLRRKNLKLVLLNVPFTIQVLRGTYSGRRYRV